MHEIQIAFKKTNSNKSSNVCKTIGWWTRGPYCHTEIIIKQNNVHYMWTADVVTNTIRRKPHKHNPSVYDYKTIKVTEEQISTILMFLTMVEDAEYDFTGIAGFIFPLRDRTDKWFCSELCSNCLKIIGYKELLPLEPALISPNRLAGIVGLLDKQYESRISTFIPFLKTLSLKGVDDD